SRRLFFFSSRGRHTRWPRDWSSDVCSSDLYLTLARDAQSSGDPVGAENYYQHAEHYFRLIAAAQEQFRQANPYYRVENEPRDDKIGRASCRERVEITVSAGSFGVITRA